MQKPIVLHPHQESALEALVVALRSRRAGLVQMPCGTGKTILFLSWIKRVAKPALVLVHRDELVQQTVRAALRVMPGCSVGVVKAERNEWNRNMLGVRYPVVVASVPTLRKPRLERIPKDRFGLVVVDEAHHAPAASYVRVLKHFQYDFCLGVTATPRRHDKVGLDHLFGDEPIFSYPLRKAIEDGQLVRIRQFAVATKIDLDAIKTATKNADFTDDQLANVVNTPDRNQAVVGAYLQHASQRKAAVFAASVKHVMALRDLFKTKGVNAAAVTGETPLDLRRGILRDFDQGRIRVLVNCMVCTEGWDSPGADCVLMARPTKSHTLYTQMVGRGLRLHDGKKDCLILDVTDNCHRHKLVTITSLLGISTEVPVNAQGRDVLTVVDEEKRKERICPVLWVLKGVCPFDDEEMPTLDDYSADNDWQMEPAAGGQLDYLKRNGFSIDKDLTYGEAAHLSQQVSKIQHKMPATPAQQYRLRELGLYVPGLTKPEASQILEMEVLKGTWTPKGNDKLRKSDALMTVDACTRRLAAARRRVSG